MICNFDFGGGKGFAVPPPNVPCGGGQTSGPPPGAVIHTKNGTTITVPSTQSPAQVRAFAVQVANQNYPLYRATFLVPSTTLMVEVGLWIALEATIGFIVGLGLASLIGQRTVAVILLVILELILTPLFSRHVVAHLINAERGIVGVAMAHVEPGGLPFAFGGNGGGGGGPFGQLVPESTLAASLVIVGWLVFWTAIGAWRMATRDT